MSVQELYYQFNQLLNSNDESKDINIGKPEFVYLYNRIAEQWLSDYIDLNKKNDKILKIKDLIVTSGPLKISATTKESLKYTLPEDFGHPVLGSVRAKLKSPCTGDLFVKIYKEEDINTVLSDVFLRPSAKWERGVATLSSNSLILYLEPGTIVDKVTMSYYKRPNKIDMEGYITFDNKPSKDVNPEYSDFIANSILDAAVTEVFRRTKDQLGFQLARERET